MTKTINILHLYRFLAINSVRQVFLLSEQELACGYCDGVSSLQTSASEVKVTFHEKNEDSVTLKLQIQISYLRSTH